MIIIGIDPGSVITGYAVIEKVKGNKPARLDVIDFGCIITDKFSTTGERLNTIHKEIEKLIIKHKPEDLDAVKKALEEKGLKIENASLDYVAKEEVTISEKEKEQAEKLFELLDDNDAVNNIYSNLKN